MMCIVIDHRFEDVIFFFYCLLSDHIAAKLRRRLDEKPYLCALLKRQNVFCLTNYQ